MTKAFVIGFTGTIASGKTARCHRLLQVAIKHQLDALHALPPTGKGGMLSVEEALQLASLNGVGLEKKTTAVESAYVPLLRGSPLSVGYLNADLLGHSVYLPGTPCYHQLIQHFGEGILARGGDGDSRSGANETPRGPADAPPINRRVLGEIAFGDPRQLSSLNAICLPPIARAFEARYDAFLAGSRGAGKRASLLILEAALLLELPEMRRRCTDVWTTSCRPAIAAARISARNGLGAAEAGRRVAAQATLAEKLEALRRGEFAGALRHFETSETTLEAGLREVEAAFEGYWRDKIQTAL